MQDSELLGELFVDNALKGLERVLTPRSAPTDSTSVPESAFQLNPTPSVDPSVSETVVTGLLECCRFLIDRLMTSAENEATAGSLCLRLMDEVVLRLLADALHVVRPDDLEHTYLVCTQPPIARQAFLQAVFSQV